MLLGLFQQKLGFHSDVAMSSWGYNSAERDSRIVGNFWDDGQHTHQQDEEKMDLWSPEKWESFQGVSRWIRAAAAANTRGLLLTSWTPHQGRADKWKGETVLSGFQKFGVVFFRLTTKWSNFFFFSTPALGDRRVHIRYLLYLADFRQ